VSVRMTRPRLAILRATTEQTPDGERIYFFAGDAWDRKTGVRVTAVVHYLLTRGLLAVQRSGEEHGKTVIRYLPTRAGREELAKEMSNG